MRSPKERHSPTSQTSAPGRWRLLPKTGPSATRTRSAEKRADNRPLVLQAPRHAPPGTFVKYGFDGAWVLVRDERARATGLRHEGDVGGVDLLRAQDADGPAQAAFVQGVAEGGAAAIAGVGQHHTQADTRLPQAVEFDQRDLTVGARRESQLVHARVGAVRPTHRCRSPAARVAPGSAQPERCARVWWGWLR